MKKRYQRPVVFEVETEDLMETMEFGQGSINNTEGDAKTNGFETDWDEDYEEDDLYGCLK